MNMAISCLKVKNLDDVKDLVRAGVRHVCERLRVTAKRKEQKDPFWKKQIESDIAKPRKDLSSIHNWFRDK